MLSGYLKCTKNTESKNPKVIKTKNGRIMLLSKCTVCNSKKLKFINEQEAKGLLSNFTGINDGCQRWLASIVYNFLIKKLLVGQLNMKLYLIKN